MKNIINITELLKGICIIGLYYLLANLYAIPFTFFITKDNYGLLNFFHVLLLVITFVLIYIKTLKTDIKSFKKNSNQYLKTGFNYWLRGVFIMIVSSLILSFLHLGISDNEETTRSLIRLYPVFEITSAIILAPILEELVFRRSFKKMTNNIHIYALTSGLVFGFVHIVSSLSNPLNILFLIPYSAVGIAFGYAYFKTDNIYTSITLHSFHNLITIIELLIIGGI